MSLRRSQQLRARRREDDQRGVDGLNRAADRRRDVGVDAGHVVQGAVGLDVRHIYMDVAPRAREPRRAACVTLFDATPTLQGRRFGTQRPNL